MEFTGLFQLFKPAGAPIRIGSNWIRRVTFAGAFDSAGARWIRALWDCSVTGTGKATYKAATNSVIDPLVIDGPTVSINGALTSPTAAVVVKSGRFGGNATLAAGCRLATAWALSARMPTTPFLSPGDGIGTLNALSPGI
jgi:hypothetical protein